MFKETRLRRDDNVQGLIYKVLGHFGQLVHVNGVIYNGKSSKYGGSMM